MPSRHGDQMQVRRHDHFACLPPTRPPAGVPDLARLPRHRLDQALSETDGINADIRKILDTATLEWGVEVTLVELKDIQLPDSRKRAKMIASEGESLAAAALGEASDTMMRHPLALQLRNLQTLVELGVEKNTTIVFPAPLISAIGELGAFLAREGAAAASPTQPVTTANGADTATGVG